ncbi:H-type small acid-soluble spore protein [Alicyclobacillus dauci]|uniref:H-type small acid-soluble spore protein n=1 Tax=Alicyclobacillus dauci TaxID=1475485 RepID=A0ABY6Z9I0_9BACL|nr:H-type small acid-soluble spore protein [Alicyclobacillus dauci]WAH39497.1 H-type small acid-soluble spore protein [Alicyclobacillus dauci]WAH39557.1 H-type small acid-soluble spore protein [Alicyclobacillus dauci]
MDIHRAKEIMESPQIINVEYRGVAVHIDQVFESNAYAEIHYEDGTVANAPLSDLREN